MAAAKKQMRIPFRHELVVVNFAGGGGACRGIVNAIGRPIDIAINHDPEAIAMHKANHPQTEHHCEDVFAAVPRKVTRGQPVGLGWFSPDCKHFSKAKGGKPVSKKIRGLAWVVVKWARTVKPRVIMLENVEEFANWGPLLASGQPCPERKGLTFRRWRKQLENCGYKVEMRELRACDYGAPTIRKRLFIIARCDGLPIVWPKPSHGTKRKPYRTAAECIDWSIRCPSIFERKRPLAEATMRRIATGIFRYVINCADPFIVPLTHHGDRCAHPVDEPMPTVTGAHRGELALITPFMAATSGPSYAQKPRAADAPINSLTADTRASVVVPTLIQTGYGERPGQAPRVPGLEKPLGTAVDGQKHALVAAFLAQHNGGANGHQSYGHDMRKPVSTITGRATQQQIVCATLDRTGNHECNASSSIIDNEGCLSDRPAGSNLEACKGALTRNADSRSAGPSGTEDEERISGAEGQHEQQAVHGLRSSCRVGDFAGSDPGRDGHKSYRWSENKQSTGEPGDCDTKREYSARVRERAAPTEDKTNPRDGGEGSKEIAGEGDAVFSNSSSTSHFSDDGFPGHQAEICSFLIQYYSSGSGITGSSLKNPAPTLTTHDRLGLVTIHGTEYAIVDIGMRMLQPRELFRAQGFGDDYIIDPIVNGKPLTKTSQVRMCGNSVCPPVAEALVRANFQHETEFMDERVA